MPSKDPLLDLFRTLARRRADFFAHLKFMRVFDEIEAPHVLLLSLSSPTLPETMVARTDDLQGNVFGVLPKPMKDPELSIYRGSEEELERWRDRTPVSDTAIGMSGVVALFWRFASEEQAMDWSTLCDLASEQWEEGSLVMGSGRSAMAYPEARDVIAARCASAPVRWRQDVGEQGAGFHVWRAGEDGAVVLLRL